MRRRSLNRPTSTVNAGPQMSAAPAWGAWEKMPGRWPPEGCLSLTSASEIWAQEGETAVARRAHLLAPRKCPAGPFV